MDEAKFLLAARLEAMAQTEREEVASGYQERLFICERNQALPLGSHGGGRVSVLGDT